AVQATTPVPDAGPSVEPAAQPAVAKPARKASGSTEDDYEAFEGPWKLDKAWLQGSEQLVERFEGHFRKNSLKIRIGDQVLTATYKLDATWKPKRIDISSEDLLLSTLGPGIYTLENDQLTICCSQLGAVRPEKFPDDPANSFAHLVLKRVKR